MRYLGRSEIGLTSVVVTALVLVSGASKLCAQWGPICEIACAASEQVSLCVYPDGDGSRNGDRLDECFAYGGNTSDATITLLLRDQNYDPVPYFPAEDMWLETEDDGMVLCPGGSIADSDTDINGMTTFSGSLRAGGSGAGILINGFTCWVAPLDIKVNSPDLDGDLFINLTDVVLFTDYFYEAYGYAADFYWDGVINLSDIVMLSFGMGSACPRGSRD
jgi:hypothetical protein